MNENGKVESIFEKSEISTSQNNDAIFTETRVGGFLSGTKASEL